MVTLFSFSFFCLIKKRVSSVGSSTPHHLTTMDNIMCTTRVLQGLSLKLHLFRCRTSTPTIKSHSYMVTWLFYCAIFTVCHYSLGYGVLLQRNPLLVLIIPSFIKDSNTLSGVTKEPII